MIMCIYGPGTTYPVLPVPMCGCACVREEGRERENGGGEVAKEGVGGWVKGGEGCIGFMHRQQETVRHL
jgi:hypothetical protein